MPDNLPARVDSKARVRIRILGRLWVTPRLPFMPGAVVLNARPHVVALSVNGGARRFVKLARDSLPPHSSK